MISVQYFCSVNYECRVVILACFFAINE
uniref:Uncharacterized protein n=1 Tax=Anguilla anguilla TaxID=7936 RepID=A0A0E9T0B9_ANGAN